VSVEAPFDDRRYTEDSIIKQLTLIELHSKDGSALDAGCGCIEGKHLFAVEGLAEEGIGFAKSEKEKKFYEELGTWAREQRKSIESGKFDDVKPDLVRGSHKLQCKRCDALPETEREACLERLNCQK